MIQARESRLSPNARRQNAELQRLRNQLILGHAYAGPQAARRVARRIEDEGGFWGPRA